VIITAFAWQQWLCEWVSILCLAKHLLPVFLDLERTSLLISNRGCDCPCNSNFLKVFRRKTSYLITKFISQWFIYLHGIFKLIKVKSFLFIISTASGRNRGAWGCSCTCSYPLPYMEVNGQFHTLAASSLGKQPPIPTEQEAVWAPWPALCRSWTTIP